MFTFIVHVYEEEWLLHVDYNPPTYQIQSANNQ